MTCRCCSRPVSPPEIFCGDCDTLKQLELEDRLKRNTREDFDEAERRRVMREIAQRKITIHQN